jgi:hypothetical protein
LDRLERPQVVIAFDADAAVKDQVRFARAELAQHLRRQGALVGFLEWDLAHGKGIDDHLTSVGPAAVLNEIARVSSVAFNRREALIRAKAYAVTSARKHLSCSRECQ